MSQENVEIVRRTYEAFSRGDLTAMFEYLDHEVVSYTAPPLPDPAEHHGYEGVLTWIGNWTEGFDDFSIDMDELIDAGDHVIAATRQRGTGAGSGVPVEQRFWFLQALRDNKIVRIGVHGTKAQAFEAAGAQK
ncbi:MAG: nuclear transport factor 2 family protein [Solirubrobacterales bacterium]